MEIKPLIYTLQKVKKNSKRFTEGEHGVRIRLSQRKEREYIHLGFSSSIINWDEKNCLPKPSHPHYKELLTKINRYLEDIALELILAKRAGRYISCMEVKRTILKGKALQ